MDHVPRVSVTMAARNVEAYVGEAIDSIIGQTFEDWELLVADDGSTDRTREIIDRYDDPRIRRLHNETRLGLSLARNKLMGHSRGEYIVNQDADDVSMPTRLAKLAETLDTNPEVALCGSFAVRYFQRSGEKMVIGNPLTYEEIMRAFDHGNRLPVFGPTRILRRNVLQHVEGFRGFFTDIGGEDHDFILRVAEKYPVANIPDVLYVYRYTRASASRKTVDKDTFGKLYIQRIVRFLADQRKYNNGLDGLMEGGDKDGFDRFIESLRQEFEKDPSIAHRRACLNKISNQDYAFALLDAVRAVKANPTVADNYFLFVRAVGSLIKTISRVSKRRLLRRRPSIC